MAIDSGGSLYISDWGNHRIRRVDPSGTISTIAGTGERGFGGDGGPAAAAQLSYPNGVAGTGQRWQRLHRRFEQQPDPQGGSIGNHQHHRGYRRARVRRGRRPGDRGATILPQWDCTGERGFGGDGGPAAAAQLSYPNGVALDSDGNVYIADSSNNRIRKVDPSGTINTIAGTGERGYGGDGGPATAARLSFPNGIALDSVGNVYIAGWFNRRIRVLTQFTDSGVERAPLLEGIRDLLPF